MMAKLVKFNELLIIILINKNEGGGACGANGGGERGAQGKPEGKSPLGRPRRRWKDNNKLDLQEV
jgi:hypothetical protein